MTIRKFSAEEARDLWFSFEGRPNHSLDCFCDTCIYFSQPKRPRYSRRTFYTACLIHRIKLDYLIENKKAKRVRYRGKWAWKIDGKAYNKAPFIDRLKEILSEVYDLTFDDSLPDASKHDSLANYIKRSGANKFIDFKDNIILTRQKEWLKTKPPISKKWQESRENAYFCQRIVDFIRSRPGHQATQRELERHFSSKRKADLESAFELLWFYPSMKRRKKGKSLIFYWTRQTKAEIEVYNQRVAKEIHKAWAELNKNH